MNGIKYHPLSKPVVQCNYRHKIVCKISHDPEIQDLVADDIMKDAEILIRNVLRKDRFYSRLEHCYADNDLIGLGDLKNIIRTIYPEYDEYKSGYRSQRLPTFKITLPFAQIISAKIGNIANGAVFTGIELTKGPMDKKLMDYFPMLAVLRDNMDNIFIAGGAISNILNDIPLNQCDEPDVDIFIYGLDKSSASRLVHTIIDKFNQYVKIVQRKHVKVIRNKHTLSIRFMRRWYQIIFRLYKTKSEILHGFDIGSSAVGWDGNEIYFTTLSAFSYITGYNIHDPIKASSTYEKRLIKYSRRGFAIAIPHIAKKDNSSLCGRISDLFDTSFVHKYQYYRSELNSIDIYDHMYDIAVIGNSFSHKQRKNVDSVNYDEYSPISHIGNGLYGKAESINCFRGVNYYWSIVAGIKYIPQLHELLKHTAVPPLELFINKATICTIGDIIVYFDKEDAIEIFKASGNKQRIIEIVARQHKAVKENIEQFISNPTNADIDWIDVNPGAQNRACGSIRPLPTSPSVYWGAGYQPFPIALKWKRVRLILLANKDMNNVWSIVNKNIMRYIIDIWSIMETNDVSFTSQRGITTLRYLTRSFHVFD